MGKESSVTRPFASVATPAQVQRGALLSQFVLPHQFSPSVASYNATRASRSCCGPDEVRLFPLRSSRLSLCSWRHSSGSGPVRSLFERPSSSRLSKHAHAAGSGPGELVAPELHRREFGQLVQLRRELPP